MQWHGNEPPLSEPKCGFDNEFCIKEPLFSVQFVLSLAILLVVVAMLGFFIFKHYHYEYKLTKLLWKIDMKDVVILHTDSEDTLQNIRSNINVRGVCFGLVCQVVG